MSRIFLSGLFLLTASSLLAQQPAGPACGTPDHRAFDFWIGAWDVYGPRGKKVGENTIDTLYSHCLIREQYTTTPGGYAGSSVNTFDASRGVWHQTWIDNGGLLLTIEGGIKGKAMVMEGDTRNSAGKAVKNRITWTPIAKDSVRQHWETWNDSTGSWTTAFNGIYVRR